MPEQGAEEEVPSEEYSVMNIKHFKMIFNRALRVKSRDIERGKAMYLYLLAKIEKLLGNPDTYYAANLYFELVRTAHSTDNP